jgi:hypothetical protein
MPSDEYYLYLRKSGMHKKDAVGKAKGDIKLAMSGQKRMRHTHAKELLRRQLSGESNG